VPYWDNDVSIERNYSPRGHNLICDYLTPHDGVRMGKLLWRWSAIEHLGEIAMFDRIRYDAVCGDKVVVKVIDNLDVMWRLAPQDSETASVWLGVDASIWRDPIH
jgi:hypothetical protein